MKKFIIIALAFLSSSALTIKAMPAVMTGHTTEQSLELLRGLDHRLSQLTSAAYNGTATEEIFSQVPLQLSMLDIVRGGLQRPYDVRLERRLVTLEARLLKLHTTALLLLERWSAKLLSDFPQYLQASQEWQQEFIGKLFKLIEILNEANNAPRGLDAQETVLRNRSQARLMQLRTALGL